MFRSKEKQLEKLEGKRRGILNMIVYYETEIKNMNTKAKKESFQSDEHHSRYVEKLKEGLDKQHQRLNDIVRRIESLEKQ